VYLKVNRYLCIFHIKIKPSSTPSYVTHIQNKFIKELLVSAKIISHNQATYKKVKKAELHIQIINLRPEISSYKNVKNFQAE
jgi:hypothetical protein